ncbi:uncharacterized protein LOC114256884 [Camellia sinensis]|uniref:uncharacterized protein LOC114256884 n=1 Tax=Camellia sinensis TaxID=4442 RepID=UPI00103683EE|nr:uncharacterized protein LOC114256884 [Camellia sinensis]
MIKENIIYRFGLLQHIVADRGIVFFGEEVQALAKEYGIELSHSTPYYALGNGQAKSTNKVLKGITERMIEDKPRIWHNAVLPMEVTVKSLRVAFHNGLTPAEYNQAMFVDMQEETDTEMQRPSGASTTHPISGPQSNLDPLPLAEDLYGPDPREGLAQARVFRPLA